MKKSILAGLIFFAGISKAQDTLFIAFSQLNFNTFNTFSFNDTLGLSYNTGYQGLSEEVNVKTKVDVFNSAGWHYNVEDQVLIGLDTLDFNQQITLDIEASMVITPAVFKNGNNTVVIWPEKINGLGKTIDSLKFNISIIGFLGSSQNDILISELQVIEQSLTLSNNTNKEQLIIINNLSGQTIQKFHIQPDGTYNTSVPKGIFFLNAYQENKKQSVKLLVK
jgi:hypothetical protein